MISSKERAGQTGFQGFPPALQPHQRFWRRCTKPTCIVEADLQPAIPVQRFIDHARMKAFVTHVFSDDTCFAAGAGNLRDNIGQQFLSEGRQDEARTVSRKDKSGGAADPGACTGMIATSLLSRHIQNSLKPGEKRIVARRRSPTAAYPARIELVWTP